MNIQALNICKIFILQRFERKYLHEFELDGEVSTETKFEYVAEFGLYTNVYINMKQYKFVDTLSAWSGVVIQMTFGR